jgi:hypothetical protein
MYLNAKLIYPYFNLYTMFGMGISGLGWKMVLQTFDMIGQVQQAHLFDESSVICYAQANVERFPLPLTKLEVSYALFLNFDSIL